MDLQTKTLLILLVIYSGYSVLKLTFFFALNYEQRRKALDRSYRGRSSATAVSDRVLLIFSLALAVLLLTDKPNYTSFLSGLLVGMTLIQIYFHRFNVPLKHDQEAPEPTSPIKQMSYAIQAEPKRAWREMLAITILVIWALVGMARTSGASSWAMSSETFRRLMHC